MEVELSKFSMTIQMSYLFQFIAMTTEHFSQGLAVLKKLSKSHVTLPPAYSSPSSSPLLSGRIRGWFGLQC